MVIIVVFFRERGEQRVTDIAITTLPTPGKFRVLSVSAKNDLEIHIVLSFT
jgi:hypothetical protein